MRFATKFFFAWLAKLFSDAAIRDVYGDCGEILNRIRIIN